MLADIWTGLLGWFHHVFIGQFDLWVAFGFAAQIMFTGRFAVQWFASERAGRSVVPPSFWYLSVIGGLLLLIYAVYRRDPVFIAGQAAGLFVYARNLWFIRRTRHDAARVG
jgi:lipid-A-disaccharide synthase-like uncharacterized protein